MSKKKQIPRKQELIDMTDPCCWECGLICIVYWSKFYNGFLAFCGSCDNQWRES